MADQSIDPISQFLVKKDAKAIEYAQKIEDMLDDWDGYGWAESTLAGIYKYIEDTGNITERQMVAVDKIELHRHKEFYE